MDFIRRRAVGSQLGIELANTSHRWEWLAVNLSRARDTFSSSSKKSVWSEERIISTHHATATFGESCKIQGLNFAMPNTRCQIRNASYMDADLLLKIKDCQDGRYLRDLVEICQLPRVCPLMFGSCWLDCSTLSLDYLRATPCEVQNHLELFVLRTSSPETSSEQAAWRRVHFPKATSL